MYFIFCIHFIRILYIWWFFCRHTAALHILKCPHLCQNQTANRKQQQHKHNHTWKREERKRNVTSAKLECHLQFYQKNRQKKTKNTIEYLDIIFMSDWIRWIFGSTDIYFSTVFQSRRSNEKPQYFFFLRAEHCLLDGLSIKSMAPCNFPSYLMSAWLCNQFERFVCTKCMANQRI